MATLSLRKKKICALTVLTVMLDENVNEKTSRRFLVSKIFQERKRYGHYHILTNKLRLFDEAYFFRFVRMTPGCFEHLFSLVGRYLQPAATRIKEPISAAKRLVLMLRFLVSGDSQ